MMDCPKCGKQMEHLSVGRLFPVLKCYGCGLIGSMSEIVQMQRKKLEVSEKLVIL